MSIGNLKTYGNKGNNFPYQLKVLQGLSIGQFQNLKEFVTSDLSPIGMQTQIEAFFTANPNYFIVSKNIVYDTAAVAYVVFITYAEL